MYLRNPTFDVVEEDFDSLCIQVACSETSAVLIGPDSEAQNFSGSRIKRITASSRHDHFALGKARYVSKGPRKLTVSIQSIVPVNHLKLKNSSTYPKNRHPVITTITLLPYKQTVP